MAQEFAENPAPEVCQRYFEVCVKGVPAECSEKISEFFKQFPTSGGVILFMGKGKAVQLLSAANIRGAVRGRIETEEEPSKKADISEIIDTVYFKRSNTRFARLLLHLRIAKALFPHSRQEHISIKNGWYVWIRLVEKWPVTKVRGRPALDAQTVCFGPFRSKKSAQGFAELINDCFGLCRNPEHLNNPQKAESCPYYQMKKCPAPCLGHISREEYLERIDSALDYVNRKDEEAIDDFTERMHREAARQNFEAAAAVKAQVDAMKQIRGEYGWVASLDRLNLLHIDKAFTARRPGEKKKSAYYSGFFIQRGNIFEISFFNDKQIPLLFESIKTFQQADISDRDTETVGDNLAIVGSFLAKKNRPGRWLLLDENFRTLTYSGEDAGGVIAG